MSFNGSGTYVPPAGQPVATNTVISSAVFNTLVTDLGNSLTNTLPRDGQASMSGQLKIIDGTSSVPGIAFNSEAASGIFRPASGMLALTVSGVEGLRLNSSGRVLIGSTTDDATNKLQVTGPVKITGALTATSFVGPLTGAVTGNVTGTAANVTGTVAIANGGTGQVTGAAAAAALGVVQQGTGVGQGSNLVKLGWGTTGGGLRMTVDTTDVGYVPVSSTNQNAGAGVTFVSPMTAQTITSTGAASITGNMTVGAAATFNSGITVAGGTTLNSSLSVSGTSSIFGPLQVTGGTTVSNGLTVANGSWTAQTPLIFNSTAPGVSASAGTGFIQLGATTATNLAMVDNQIQARNNSVASALYLQYNGGALNLGGASPTAVAITGTLTTTASINATGSLTTNDILYCRYSGNLKIALCDSATTRGYISADASNCFRTINAANSAYTFSVDNSGNAFCSGAFTSTGGLFGNNVQITAGQATMRMSSTNGSRSMVLDGGNTFIWLTTQGASATYAQDNGLFVSTTITQSSDERLKENWTDIKPTFLADLASVKHGTYDLIDEVEDKRHVGVSAQSLQSVLPEAVFVGQKGMLAVNYGNAALVASIKLAQKVVDLESDVSALRELVAKFMEVKV